MYQDNKMLNLCLKYNDFHTTEKQRTQLLDTMFESVGKNTEIRPPIFVDDNNKTTIGDNCKINHNCKFIDYGSYVKIGNNVAISAGATFIACDHPKNPLLLDEWVDIPTPIVIEDDVWIGANVTILGNVTIGEGAVIGAGSVVTKDIPPNEVWCGNPATFLRKNKEK